MSQTRLDLQPVLMGENIRLRPLDSGDFASLFQVANDPLIWEQHPSSLRYQRDVFEREVFETGLKSKSTLVITDSTSSQVIGSSRFYDIDEEKCALAIGYTFLARSHWGGVTNKEVKSLMLNHAFTWASRVWFHVGSCNIRSCRALEKIGAKLSHVESRDINGEPIDHCYYFINR